MSRGLVARLTLICLVMALVVCSSPTSVEAEERTWSDASGQFQLEAEFVSLKNGMVTLRLADDSEVEISLENLSAADQKVAEKAAKNPFQPKSASPFQPKMEAEGEDAPATSEQPVESRTVEVNWNMATAANPQPQANSWNGVITAEQLVEGAPSLEPRTVRLPDRRDFFEKARNIVFSPSGEKGAVGYTLKKPGSQDVSTRIVLFETATGKLLGSDVIEGEYVPLGLEDDGRRLLVRSSKFGFGGSGRLEVWSLTESGVQQGLKWTPHDGQRGGNGDIHWGTIVADGRGLTISGGGRLVLWDLDTGKPVWYLDTNGAHDPALSPNGKYLAYQAKDAIGLLEVDSGTVLALLPTEESRLGGLAFSPDGRFLAGSSHEILWIWDAVTGNLFREVNVKNLAGLQDLFWASPEYVMLADQWLIHAESRIPVWQYTRGAPARSAGGVTWFYLSPHTGGEGLVGADLPHAAAEQALASAMADPNFFVLKPGSTVSIDVSGIPSADQARVKEMLTKNLKETGFKVAESGAATVKVSMKRGKGKEIHYRNIGRLGGSTHKVREYILNLAFVTDGKTAWQTKSVRTPAPFMVNLDEGETIDELLRKSDKPGYEFFEQVRLPKFVARPSEQSVLGSSAVSMQGVR